RAALLADEHVLYLVLLEKLVVDREYGAARIAEDVLNSLVLKRRNDHFGARHRACHTSISAVLVWWRGLETGGRKDLPPLAGAMNLTIAHPAVNRQSFSNLSNFEQRLSICCASMCFQDCILRLIHVNCRLA